jgi:esterase/lipase superfamily enzyme
MRSVQGSFTDLRFRTRPTSIVVDRITFVFTDRQRQFITRRIRTSATAWSPTNVRWPRGRRIAQIIFDYTRRRGRTSVLEIQGRRLGSVASPGNPPTARRPGQARRRYDRRRRYYRRHDRRYSSGPRRSAPSSAPGQTESARRQAEEAARQRAQAERQRQEAETRRRAEVAERRRAAAPRSQPEPRSVRPETPRAPDTSPGSSGSSGAEPQPRTAIERSGRTEPKPDCVKTKVCTLVRIFFGTNRKKDEGESKLLKRVSFGSERQNAPTVAEELTLGRAIVTVPRAINRAPGEIARPGFLEGAYERYWLGVTPKGDPSRHFVIVRNGFELYSNTDDFARAVAAHQVTAGKDRDHAFVFVHGYNTKLDHALFRTAQIAYDLGSKNEAGVYTPFGTPFMFSWPSAGGELFYPYDQESARFAVAHLKLFLDLIIKKTRVRKLHLIAHSMGNIPLLNALAQIAQQSSDHPGTKIDQVILAAPDMDAVEFKKLAARIKPITKGITMYSSSSDAAMDISRKLHNNHARAGDVVTGRPVIATGVQTIDISLITTCYFCTGHSEYVEQPTLLADISSLLHAGLRPPNERNGTLRLERLDAVHEFWRYRP